jgi:hypothetical protein
MKFGGEALPPFMFKKNTRNKLNIQKINRRNYYLNFCTGLAPSKSKSYQCTFYSMKQTEHEDTHTKELLSDETIVESDN